MRVHKIELANFTVHKSTTVELPATGVVLVTGRNGQGKSSIAEGVAHAVWGQAIRGKPGWVAGVASGALVEFGGGMAHRTVSKSGAKALTWRVDASDDGAGRYPTTSKSQEALEEHVGSFEVWRRACVFSQDSVGRFTLATDAERKRLLEDLFGLDRFDAAYKRAREELNAAKKSLVASQGTAAVLAERLSGLQARIDQAVGAADLSEVESLDDLRAEAAELRERITKATAEYDRAKQAEDAAAVESANAAAIVAACQRRIDGFARLGPSCPTCEQTISEAHACDVQDEAADVLAVAKARMDQARQAHAIATRHRAEVESDLSTKKDALRDVTARGLTVKAEIERRQQWQEVVDDLKAQQATAEAEHSTAAAKVKRLESEAEELEACCSVLGLQGVRAAVLASSLGDLQQSANSWLSLLGMVGLRVEIGSQTTSKTGAVSDKISFDVIGAGGGHGYLASSGGERRRIDIAVMLALSDAAASGSHGVGKLSTLFVDELFDALDDEGVEATADVLNEIAMDRCVVVVSHNRALADRLPEARHLHVTGGQVVVQRG